MLLFAFVNRFLPKVSVTTQSIMGAIYMCICGMYKKTGIVFVPNILKVYLRISRGEEHGPPWVTLPMNGLRLFCCSYTVAFNDGFLWISLSRHNGIKTADHRCYECTALQMIWAGSLDTKSFR